MFKLSPKDKHARNDRHGFKQSSQHEPGEAWIEEKTIVIDRSKNSQRKAKIYVDRKADGQIRTMDRQARWTDILEYANTHT